ncbi:MAG: GYF domain-containing protein [Gemmata sp.]
MAIEWYYFKGENKIGPLSSLQLKQIASDGTLGPTDLVWKEGLSKSIPAEKIKGLFDSVKAPSEPRPHEAPPDSTASGAGWYYARGDQHNGPVQLQQMLALIAANQLCATDLVWNESLPDWIPASAQPELAAALPKVPDPQPEANYWRSITEEEALPGEVAEPPQRGIPRARPRAVQPQAALPGEVAELPRLPNGVTVEDVIACCEVQYRGGHPNQTENASGNLNLTKGGLFFVAADPAHDIRLSSNQLLDVLAPVPGSFSEQMVASAEQSRAAAGMGRQIFSIAGALVGGLGGHAIQAIGRSASGTATLKSLLGPTPKNRLLVVAVESGARHKLIFDVMADDKHEMELQADGFWRKVASVRSTFASAAGNPTSIGAPALHFGAPAPQSGFFVSRAGVVSGPFTDVTVKQMLANGELGSGDLIRVEAWLPLSLITLFGAGGPRAHGPRRKSPSDGAGGLHDDQIGGDGDVDSSAGADADHDGQLDPYGTDSDGDDQVDAQGDDHDEAGQIDDSGSDFDSDSGDIDW